MNDLGTYLLYGLALIFVIEGLIYALFPRQIQKIMAMASIMDNDKFRYFGASMVAFGVLCVWLLQKFNI